MIDAKVAKSFREILSMHVYDEFVVLLDELLAMKYSNIHSLSLSDAAFRHAQGEIAALKKLKDYRNMIEESIVHGTDTNTL